MTFLSKIKFLVYLYIIIEASIIVYKRDCFYRIHFNVMFISFDKGRSVKK